MENTLESAQSYIKHLDNINVNWNLDKSIIDSCFISYAAKVNKINKEKLKELFYEFRKWDREWNLFFKQERLQKPKSIDEFIEELLLKYK